MVCSYYFLLDLGFSLLLENKFDRNQLAALRVAFEEMKKLDSVMVKLQSSDITLSDVRKLFDHCLKTFPGMASHLATDAKIVHSPDFESALVKLIREVCTYFFLFYFFSFLTHFYICFLMS